MTPDDDAAFRDVKLGSREASACSPPDPGPEWRGIRIRLPARVVLGAKSARVPVCGLYSLDLLAIRKAPEFRLLALDLATGLSHGGVIRDRDDGSPAPDPLAGSLSAADLEGLSTASYFNENLFEHLRLPAKPGRYTVTVEYGGQRSNSVTFDLVAGR